MHGSITHFNIFATTVTLKYKCCVNLGEKLHHMDFTTQIDHGHR